MGTVGKCLELLCCTRVKFFLHSRMVATDPVFLLARAALVSNSVATTSPVFSCLLQLPSFLSLAFRTRECRIRFSFVDSPTQFSVTSGSLNSVLLFCHRESYFSSRRECLIQLLPFFFALTPHARQCFRLFAFVVHRSNLFSRPECLILFYFVPRAQFFRARQCVSQFCQRSTFAFHANFI